MPFPDLDEVYKSQWLESVGYPPSPGGPIKEDSIHDVKFEGGYLQTAQVHTIRKGDESNSEEDQDHNYRHGAEYWESVD